MSVQGKGKVYIGDKLIGEATYELNLAPPRHPEQVSTKIHRTKEDAEKHHGRSGGCLAWCKCRSMLCFSKAGHGSPYHFFPAHDCAEKAEIRKELGLIPEEVVEADPLLDG